MSTTYNTITAPSNCCKLAGTSVCDTGTSTSLWSSRGIEIAYH
jgi:hypothetical protein